MLCFWGVSLLFFYFLMFFVLNDLKPELKTIYIYLCGRCELL